MKKKVLSMLITFAMLFSMLPATALAVEGEGTIINLSGGSCTIETAGEYAVSAYNGANTLTVKANATITLAGVNITAAADTSAISIESGSVTLIVDDDSTLIGGDNGAGIYVAEDASVTIQSKNNAKLTAIGNAGEDDNSGAAGIGGTKDNGNSGAITINGATVLAKGHGRHGAGIGSGNNGKVKGEIKIINSADVTAYGGYCNFEGEGPQKEGASTDDMWAKRTTKVVQLSVAVPAPGPPLPISPLLALPLLPSVDLSLPVSVLVTGATVPISPLLTLRSKHTVVLRPQVSVPAA